MISSARSLAARARQRLGGTRLAPLVAWIAVLSIGLLTLPDVDGAIRFPDTRSYLRWPAQMLVHGVEIMGARAAAYPLILDAVGIGPPLVRLQWLFAVLAWAFLGWTLARIPGCVIGALLALAPPLAAWNLAALTESFDLSLLVLAVALSLQLARSWRPLTVAAWIASLIPLAFIRDVNLLMLPVVLIPAFAHFGRRGAAIGLVAVIVFGGALVDATRQGRARIYTYQAIWWRVNSSPEHREWFEARGMPTLPMSLDDAKSLEAYHLWLADGGVWTYRRWALTRWRHFETTFAQFRQPDPSPRLVKKYFASVEIPPGGVLATSGDLLYRLAAPPRVIWLLAILSLPVVGFWRHRRLGVSSVMAVVLAATAGIYGLVAFVSDFAEISRHMLGAFVLYRVGFLVAGLAWVELIRAPAPRSRSSC